MAEVPVPNGQGRPAAWTACLYPPQHIPLACTFFTSGCTRTEDCLCFETTCEVLRCCHHHLNRHVHLAPPSIRLSLCRYSLNLSHLHSFSALFGQVFLMVLSFILFQGVSHFPLYHASGTSHACVLSCTLLSLRSLD